MTFAPQTSNDAVKKATGKIWDEWFRILDKETAQKLSHSEIVQIVYKKYKVKPWWSQMVANTYEQARGLRNKYENAAGFNASVSRTIDKSSKVAYDTVKRFKGYKITTDRPEKTIRGVWVADDSRIIFAFYAKGKDKTQVVVQQEKLKNAAAVKRAKDYWTRF